MRKKPMAKCRVIIQWTSSACARSASAGNVNNKFGVTSQLRFQLSVLQMTLMAKDRLSSKDAATECYDPMTQIAHAGRMGCQQCPILPPR